MAKLCQRKPLFTIVALAAPAIWIDFNYWQPGDALALMVLPEINASEWLINAKHQYGKILLKTLLHQKL